MTFAEEKVDAFLKNFEEHKNSIRNFEGCKKLVLLQDVAKANVFFTYSWWQGEAYLEQYRKSELFKGVWTFTKTLFSAKPEAWSLNEKVTL